MFGMLSVFSEFERAIIQERIAAGMARAKVKGTKSGKPIGRPRIASPIKDRIRAAHRAGGVSLRDLAAQFRVGRETVRRVLCALPPTSARPCELGSFGSITSYYR